MLRHRGSYTGEGVMKITRKEAIRLICKITDQDDPYWEQLTYEYYDEETDTLLTFDEVMNAVGITDDEIKEAENLGEV